MSNRVRAFVIVSLAAGPVFGAGAVIALEATVFRPPPKVAREPRVAPPPTDSSDDDGWEAANASLVASLAECNRRLRDAGQRQVAAPQPAPAPAASSAEGGRGRRGGGRERGPLTREDWERHAEAGTVPYRIPCLRDTPFTPSARDIERLGLAPDDAIAVRDAYAESNKRVTEQITPICATVVGADAAQKIGPAACMKAIQDSSRRADPAKMRESLVHVAEANAGKREPPKPDAAAAERLFSSLTSETKAFEADLAKRLGPEDAARIANARGLCEERGVAAASDEPARGGAARGRRAE